jgi:pSer/pThr/pTyr-binding forkhead associated (FHA) protein
MPYLIVRSQKRVVSTVRLEKGKNLSIGRLNSNDIVISDPSVSGQHAELESEGDYFFLTDRQSRNGSFVNKQLVLSRRLKHKDIVTIGNHNLIFAYKKGESRPPEGEDFPPRKTVALDTEQHRLKLARSVSAMVTREVTRQKVPVLTFLSDPKADLIMSKPVLKIGRDKACDIQVKGLFMGKIAAVIEHREQGFFISHAQGFVKPKVNFKPVRKDLQLREFDVITIGRLKLQFNFRFEKTGESTA